MKRKRKSLAQIAYEANGSIFGKWPSRYDCVRDSYERSARAILRAVAKRIGMSVKEVKLMTGD